MLPAAFAGIRCDISTAQQEKSRPALRTKRRPVKGHGRAECTLEKRIPTVDIPFRRSFQLCSTDYLMILHGVQIFSAFPRRIYIGASGYHPVETGAASLPLRL